MRALWPSLLTLSLAAQAPDGALYKERTLLPREREEEAVRNRYLANQRGLNYRQAEESAGRILSLDFSHIDRPKDLKDFQTSWHFPPKRQWWTNTCWCFSTTSFLESEIKRLHGKELKLSEMFTVYWEYVSKVEAFVRTKGGTFVGEGSQSGAVLRQWRAHGIVRESDYPGLANGQPVYTHVLLFEEVRNLLAAIRKAGTWDERAAIRDLRVILDKHLGKPPETILVEGMKCTPQQFLKEQVCLNLDDYVELMSLKTEPFWAKAEYPVPDNWWHSRDYWNVPLDAWYAALLGAVKQGYSVAIGGDVSEPGYEGSEDCAIIPTFDLPQDAINQDSREFRFANKTTDDDHGIHIIGHTQRHGRDWFLIKDSARSSQRGIPGYTFYRDDYVRLKMLTYMVHKDAVKDLMARFPK